MHNKVLPVNTLQKLLVGLGLAAMVMGIVQLYTSVQKKYTPVVAQETIQENNPVARYSLNIAYPQFSTLGKEEEDVNKAIKSLITKTITNFRVAAEEAPPINNLSGELFIRYQVIQATDKIISVWFTVEDMQAGYAHPNNYNLTFNYDVERNKILTLRDVFNTENNHYLTFLSDFTSKQLTEEDKKQKVNNSFFIQTGLAPRVANFEKFVIGSNNLIFIFDPAQTAPDAFGTRTVDIPFEKMRVYLQSW